MYLMFTPICGDVCISRVLGLLLSCDKYTSFVFKAVNYRNFCHKIWLYWWCIL